MQNAKDLSGGRLTLGAGTLYGAINTLLGKGWIVSVGNTGNDINSRQKKYVITDAGKKAVTAEISRLTELLDNGKRITGLGGDYN